MDEFIYNLLLTGPQGLTLFGILRYRLLRSVAPAVDGALAELPAAASASDIAVIRVVPIPVEGTLSVPLVTGLRQVPIAGMAIITLETGAFTVFLGTDPARPLVLKFSDVGGFNIAGGLWWRPLQPTELTFSLLSLRNRLAA